MSYYRPGRDDVVGGMLVGLLILLALVGFAFAVKLPMPLQPGECKTYVRTQAERRGDTLFHFPDTTYWCAK